MTIKELIKAKLDNLSEEEVDEWDTIIQDCQIDTDISDLAYQHHHHIHDTPKIEIE